jgi:hypothetical protein
MSNLWLGRLYSISHYQLCIVETLKIYGLNRHAGRKLDKHV